MKSLNPPFKFILFTVLCVFLSSCAPRKYDYSVYRQHFPRSIVVLPAVNTTADIDASNLFMSTISRPLAECGYYVFPIAIVDQMLKENGVANPYEMHQVPLNKLSDVFGADAVLYVNIEEWGTKYSLLRSVTQVKIQYRLVDTSTGAQLWSMNQVVTDDSGGGRDLVTIVVSAAVHAISNTLAERERTLALQANSTAMNGRFRLLKGPYHPGHQQDLSGQKP